MGTGFGVASCIVASTDDIVMIHIGNIVKGATDGMASLARVAGRNMRGWIRLGFRLSAVHMARDAVVGNTFVIKRRDIRPVMRCGAVGMTSVAFRGGG